MLTPTPRYPCCEHCSGEGCPRMSGHTVPCGTKGCPSFASIAEKQESLPNTTDHAMEDIMPWLDEDKIRSTKEELLALATTVVGHEQAGLREAVKLLSHPIMLRHTIEYFGLLNPIAPCLHYEAPWSCIHESEARFENLQHGWTGGMYKDDPSTWCESCLSKVKGRPVLDEEGDLDDCGETDAG